jgi:hypothetical protein
MLIQYLSESLKLHERGDASFQDIDIAMKLGAGYIIVKKKVFKSFQIYSNFFNIWGSIWIIRSHRTWCYQVYTWWYVYRYNLRKKLIKL